MTFTQVKNEYMVARILLKCIVIHDKTFLYYDTILSNTDFDTSSIKIDEHHLAYG